MPSFQIRSDASSADLRVPRHIADLESVLGLDGGYDGNAGQVEFPSFVRHEQGPIEIMGYGLVVRSKQLGSIIMEANGNVYFESTGRPEDHYQEILSYLIYEEPSICVSKHHAAVSF